jgi:6-phosphogluconolactonase
VAVAPSGRFVAVANYVGGSVALLPVLDDGHLGEVCAFQQHKGSGAHPTRQEGPHAHSVTFDPDGHFLYVADLGIDKVLIYRYDEETGSLEPHGPGFAPLSPGSGPRHCAIHPTGQYFYVVNELGNTVTAFLRKPGLLESFQTISTLPESYKEESYTAEIRVHPTGRLSMLRTEGMTVSQYSCG